VTEVKISSERNSVGSGKFSNSLGSGKQSLDGIQPSQKKSLDGSNPISPDEAKKIKNGFLALF